MQLRFMACSLYFFSATNSLCRAQGAPSKVALVKTLSAAIEHKDGKTLTGLFNRQGAGDRMRAASGQRIDRLLAHRPESVTLEPLPPGVCMMRRARYRKDASHC